jgi:hypothetical protein
MKVTELQEVLTRNEAITRDLAATVRDFGKKIEERVNTLEKKIEEKHTPLKLEGDILRTIQVAMNEAISKVLTGYDSPLTLLIKKVVEKNRERLQSIIEEAFDTVIAQDEFKRSIVAAFSHKVSRAIISNNAGLFDTVSNELRKDAVFKSKMTLAVARVVEECLHPMKTNHAAALAMVNAFKEEEDDEPMPCPL